MRSISTYAMLSIIACVPTVLLAQNVSGGQAQPLQDFRGLIKYDGSVVGTAVIPPAGSMELSLNGLINGLLNKALNTRTVQLSGNYHVEAEYEGNIVRGRSVVDSQIDGMSENHTFSGTREGEICHLTYDTGQQQDVICNSDAFYVKVNYTNPNGQKIKALYSANRTEVTDYVERDRLQALADAEAEVAAKRAAQNGRISRTAVMSDKGVVEGDILVPVRELKGATKLSVSIRGADDIAQFILIDSKGKVHSIAWAEWNAERGAGADTGDATKLLRVGRNALIFYIHNKQFSFGAGKWAFQASVAADSKLVWTASGGAPGGSVGIQFWKPIYIDKLANGTFAIVKPNSKKMQDGLAMMKIVNDQLLAQYATEQSAANMIVGGLLSSFFGSSSGGSSSSSCDGQCQTERWNDSKEFNEYYNSTRGNSAPLLGKFPD